MRIVRLTIDPTAAGPGMVMKYEPLADAIVAAKSGIAEAAVRWFA